MIYFLAFVVCFLTQTLPIGRHEVCISGEFQGGDIGACPERDNLTAAGRVGAVTKPAAEPGTGRGTVTGKGEWSAW